jgi:hypothetical protein
MLIEGLLGTVMGIAGSAVTGIFKYKEKKLDIENTKINNTHEIAKIKAESEAMIEEAKANIKVTQSKVEGEIELKDIDAFIESQKQGNQSLFSNKWVDALLQVEGKWRIITYPIASAIAILFGFVDFLRGMIRPSMTIYLCGVTTYITWMAWEIMQKQGISIPANDAVTIFKDTTSVVLFMTTSIVSWWFGDRRLSKNVAELKGIDVNKMDDKINI